VTETIDARAELERAVAEHQAGRLAAAEQGYRRVLANDPDYPDALHFLGLLRHQLGKSDEAVALIRRAIARKPDFAGFHFNLGNVLREAGQAEAAVESYREADRLAPGSPSTLNNLGNALFDRGRPDQAVDTLQRAVAIDPDFAEAHLNLGYALRETRRSEAADHAFDRALALDGTLVGAHVGRGVGAQLRGEFAAAEKSFRRALAIDPDDADAIYNLAMLGGLTVGDPDVERLEALADAGTLPPDRQIELHFALGKLYDDDGDTERAIGHFQAGNGLRYGQAPYDETEIADLVSACRSVFTPDFFAQRRALGNRSERPVFIVGMPRSGTTLVEQILASHPQVHGAGELGIIGNMAEKLPDGASYPAGLIGLEKAQLDELSNSYLSLTGGDGETVRTTDKMPDNFRWLGLIAILFPLARIIHCRRDPIDNCLSCYFQLFKRQHAYAYELETLGLYYRRYDELMDHWRRVLPLPIFELRYENLIADQESVTRALVEFNGLPWDDRCLAFQELEREVRTASVWQVRQPIYTHSVGRWRRYERFLRPLIAALGPLADTG